MDTPGFGMRPRSGQGRWGERIVAEASAIPAAWLRIDQDDAATGSEESEGSGFGGRLAVGNRDQSIGLLYQGLEFAEEPGEASVHAGFVDFDVRVPLQDGGGWFSLVVGAGFGAARFDSGVLGADVTTEGAAQIRVGLECTPSRNFAIGLGGGGVVFGHPGETEAYGTFALVDLVFSF
jgi:hypothetical protein